ncbi:hypothetical protein QFZ20_001540 [Flavobacterium sp. W4I14]|nr:hypothetical protein [Flavobacterium sp. W4I14]
MGFFRLLESSLRQWGMMFMHDLEKMMDQKLKGKTSHEDQEWLRSRAVRRIAVLWIFLQPPCKISVLEDKYGIKK